MKLKPFAAELIATYLFVLVGVGSVAASSLNGSSLGQLGPAFAHGVGLAILVTATMHISGGQLNPAVTLGVWLGNQITFAQAIANIFAQLAGSVAALFTLYQCLPRDILESASSGLPMLGDRIGTYQGLALEAVMTFMLVLAVFGTAVDRRVAKVGGLYIGLTVLVAAIFVGPFTGACLNPARYFGPALIESNWADLVVYIGGPILGGALAALVYTYGIGREEKLDLPGEATI